MKKTILTLAAFVVLTLAACNQGGNNNAQNAQQLPSYVWNGKKFVAK